MVDMLFEGRYDLYILYKYKDGDIVDPKDEAEIERLSNIGMMRCGISAMSGEKTAIATIRR